MGVPGRTAAWAAVSALLVLALGAGIASVVSSSAGRSTAETVPNTSVPPTPSSTTTSPLPSTIAPAPVQGVVAVAFINGSDGYGLFSEDTGGVSCSLSVASTHDGGATFSAQVPLPSAAQCSPTLMSFDNVGDGFVFGPGLYVTHDGGTTWTDDSPSATVLDVVPLGRSVWMLQTPSVPPDGVRNLALAVSNDGGRTWLPARALPSVTSVGGDFASSDAASLVRTSASTAYAVISTSPTAATVFTTMDGAQTWHHVLVPCLGGWAEILSQAFDHTLWLVCAGQPGAGSQLKSVMRSFDGGETWVQGSTCPPLVTSTTYPPCTEANGLGIGYLGGMAALSGATAFIDGNRSPVIDTHDGGKTWALANPLIGDINGSAGLFFANQQDGWVISETYGNGGALWRTTDGGGQWSQVWP